METMQTSLQDSIRKVVESVGWIWNLSRAGVDPSNLEVEVRLMTPVEGKRNAPGVPKVYFDQIYDYYAGGNRKSDSEEKQDWASVNDLYYKDDVRCRVFTPSRSSVSRKKSSDAKRRKTGTVYIRRGASDRSEAVVDWVRKVPLFRQDFKLEGFDDVVLCLVVKSEVPLTDRDIENVSATGNDPVLHRTGHRYFVDENGTEMVFSIVWEAKTKEAISTVLPRYEVEIESTWSGGDRASFDEAMSTMFLRAMQTQGLSDNMRIVPSTPVQAHGPRHAIKSLEIVQSQKPLSVVKMEH